MPYKIAFIFVEVLALLGLAEAAAAVAERLRPERAEIGFDYAPYRMLRMERAPWPLNRDGFRARELDTYRGHFLVEFLGGSVCLGVGVNPGLTVAERLEHALDRRGLARAQVLNLCQGGATSAQELAIFLEYGLPLRPQVVLSFDGANDLMHPRPVGSDDSPNLPYRDREMRAGFRGQDHTLLAHLALGRVAARIARRRPADPAAGAPVPPAAILASYEYALSVTGRLAESSGASYAVLLQPTLHYRKRWSEEEQRMWKARDPIYGPAVAEAARRIYATASDSMAEWAARSGTRLFDLTGAFESSGETVYSDSVHFSGEGGNRVLYAELETEGLADEIERRYRIWERQAQPAAGNERGPEIHTLENRNPENNRRFEFDGPAALGRSPWAERQVQ